MKNTPQLAAFAFLGLPIMAAYAAEKPSAQTTEALPEITVKGKRLSLTTPAIESIREEIQQTPGGVSVVDAETYKRGRSTTIKDALDDTPGGPRKYFSVKGSN